MMLSQAVSSLSHLPTRKAEATVTVADSAASRDTRTEREEHRTERSRAFTNWFKVTLDGLRKVSLQVARVTLAWMGGMLALGALTLVAFAGVALWQRARVQPLPDGAALVRVRGKVRVIDTRSGLNTSALESSGADLDHARAVALVNLVRNQQALTQREAWSLVGPAVWGGETLPEQIQQSLPQGSLKALGVQDG
jgi:hypothetical protein